MSKAIQATTPIRFDILPINARRGATAADCQYVKRQVEAFFDHLVDNLIENLPIDLAAALSDARDDVLAAIDNAAEGL